METANICEICGNLWFNSLGRSSLPNLKHTQLAKNKSPSCCDILSDVSQLKA